MSQLEMQCVCCAEVKQQTIIIDCFHVYCVECLEKLGATNEYETKYYCKDCNAEFSGLLTPTLFETELDSLPLIEIRSRQETLKNSIETGRQRRSEITVREKKLVEENEAFKTLLDSLPLKPIQEALEKSNKYIIDLKIKEKELIKNIHNATLALKMYNDYLCKNETK